MSVDKLHILAGEAAESLAYFADVDARLSADMASTTGIDGALSTTGSFANLRDGGWISEDGLTVGREIATEDLPAYGTKQPVRTFVTTDTRTFAVNFLETNPVSVSVYSGLPLASGATGSIADGSTGMAVVAGAAQPNRSYSCVFDVLDPGRGRVRYLVPSAQVTTMGEIVYRGGQAAIRPITLTAQPVSVGVPVGVTGLVTGPYTTVSVVELISLDQ